MSPSTGAPPAPPPRSLKPTPGELLNVASAVLANDEQVLDGRRAVTAAALARQAVENMVDDWLAASGAPGRSSQRDAFLCLAALHPDPALARSLHNTWARLSDACHATSYELPPTVHELERWMAVARKFIQ